MKSHLRPRGEEGGGTAESGAHGRPRGRGERAAVDVHARVLLLPLGPTVLEPDFDLQIVTILLMQEWQIIWT